MKRTFTLAVLLGAGVLAIGVHASQAPQAGPNVVTVDKVKDNLYVLKGGGGNTAVFVMSNGVTVVDAKNPGWGQPILDKIKELTPKPVVRLINTHAHGDHVSGNVEFPVAIDYVAQENTKANMESMDIFKQNAGHGLPKRTFKDRMTIGSGADEIDLYYFGPGHTNGDAWVAFPALRVVHAGDLFASKALPLVDPANGGSVLHFAETLNKAYAGIKNVDVVINGHNNTTTTWADLKEFAAFNEDFLNYARAALKAGKSPADVAAGWKVPEHYQGYSPNYGNNFGGLAARVQRLADELK